MNNRFSIPALVTIIASLFLGMNSLFIVDQTQQALVIQFGKSRHVYTAPGLKFKWPFIQDVLLYDHRVLDLDLPPIRVTTGDQKRLIVDTYTRYKIDDLLLFFQTVKPANEDGVRMRLEAIVSSSVRNILGKMPLRAMLSHERSTAMGKIEEEVRTMVKPLGIGIIDVRLIRTELPKENRHAVFARMNAELERYAKENRAKGDEMAQKIRAYADKDRSKILADAEKQAKIIRATGEAHVLTIASEAFSKDLDFYKFYSWNHLYQETMTPETNLILGTDSPLASFFEKNKALCLDD